MLKKILFCLLLLAPSGAFASDLPFTDVPLQAPYYSDLKRMYQAGVIADTTDHLFHPDSLLSRDQFVGVTVGVSCRKCLYPTPEDIIRYNTDPFADVTKKNQYFYCVSYAKEKEIVRGYVLDRSGHAQCQDGQDFAEVPFCPANNITRIEAVAVLLRQAGLWNETLNIGPYDKKAGFRDVDDYWYGYAQKAVESGLATVSAEGKFSPNEYITKREFVTMAARIFTLNLCSIKNENSSPSAFASTIKVLDKAKQGCSTQEGGTTFSDGSEDTYDFGWYATGSLKIPLSYSWIFANSATGEQKSATGNCLNDFRLGTNGSWVVKMTVTDAGWKQSVAYQQVSVKNGGLSVQISESSDPLKTSYTSLNGMVGVPMSFVSTTSGGDGHYGYRWDFSDGGTAQDKDVLHTFMKEGVYPVSLTVRDTSGNVAYARSVVVISPNPDRDNDGVLDYDSDGNVLDLCPDAAGPSSNRWCPMVDEYTSITSPVGNICLSEKIRNSGRVEWGVQCASCPCEYSAEFIAQIRSCDIVFPSIVSPDKRTLYSRGKIFPVP